MCLGFLPEFLEPFILEMGSGEAGWGDICIEYDDKYMPFHLEGNSVYVVPNGLGLVQYS